MTYSPRIKAGNSGLLFRLLKTIDKSRGFTAVFGNVAKNTSFDMEKTKERFPILYVSKNLSTVAVDVPVENLDPKDAISCAIVDEEEDFPDRNGRTLLSPESPFPLEDPPD